MRNRLFAAFVISAFAFGNANAATIASDTFDYADGSLVPNGGWANHSGTMGTMLVASTQVEIQMNGSAPEDANLAFTPVAGSVYYALDFSVTAAAAVAGGDYEYFAHFKDATFGFRGRLDVVGATAGGDFTLGISTDTSTAQAIWGTDLTFGTTYRAIVKYDQDANIATLWVDATLETDPSISGTDQADPGDEMIAFALRQSFSSSGEMSLVDNVCVGTSFDDVALGCGTIAVEESTWGQVKSLYSN